LKLVGCGFVMGEGWGERDKWCGRKPLPRLKLFSGSMTRHKKEKDAMVKGKKGNCKYRRLLTERLRRSGKGREKEKEVQ